MIKSILSNSRINLKNRSLQGVKLIIVNVQNISIEHILLNLALIMELDLKLALINHNKDYRKSSKHLLI